MAKILIVEDEKKLSETVERWLTFEHHTVEVVDNGIQALEHLRFYKYDLVILDWALPGKAGIDVCKEFRALGGMTLVLMLTGKKELHEIESGLDAGADDYLTKPFHPRELSARVRTMLRRTPKPDQGKEISVGGLILYPGAYKVVLEGEEIRLSPQEFRILEFLIKHSDRIVTTEELLAHMCETDESIGSDSIRTRIKLLRKKLDKVGEPSWIRNVHGVGYQFVPLD